MNKQELNRFIDKISPTGPGGVEKIKRVLKEVLDKGEEGITEEELLEALSGKQDTIQDLETIRSGAAKGETSVQPLDIEDMVKAEPIGSIIPPVNPSEFATKEEVSQLEAELGQKVSREEIIGDGNTYVSQDIYGLVPGHSYRVYLLNENYDRSGVTLSGSGWAWFSGGNVKADNSEERLFGSYAPSLPKPYYDFVLPTDTKYIRIGCRATQGEKVGFTIEDLTEVIPMFRPVGVTTLSQLIDMGLTFTQGSFNSSGKESANTGRVRCDKALPTDIGVIAAPDGFVIHEVYYYSSWTDDSNFTFVGPYISVGAKYYWVETSQPLFRFSIRKANDGTTTPEELYAALPLSALASSIGFISLMRNGSLNNPFNANGVATPVINTCGRKAIGINITRPNTPGYHYVFDYALSSSYNDIGVTKVSTQWEGRVLMVENATENTFDFSAYPSAVGVAFAIFEKDDSNNVNPLRKEDFNGYKIELVYLSDAPSIETPMRNFAFNSVFDTADIDNKCKEFSALFNNSGAIETFAFMTDPHLLGVNNSFNKDTFKMYIGRLQKYYNMLPIDWMICGGDWLNSGDYQASACWKLGYMDATMRKLFKHYFPVLGNHDTNYQGVVSSEDSNRGDLTHQTLVNLMFRENGNTYYKFKGNNTQFYVFDTGIDWSAAMDSFKWEQIDWFANALLQDDAEHTVIIQHIFYTSGTTVNPMATNIQTIAGAYNSRSSVTLNGNTYDFSGCTGKIACAIAGHSHFDEIVTDDVSVPVWLTTNMTDGNTPTFDLCVIDYTANEMKSIRVGTGSDRTMPLV